MNMKMLHKEKSSTISLSYLGVLTFFNRDFEAHASALNGLFRLVYFVFIFSFNLKGCPDGGGGITKSDSMHDSRLSPANFFCSGVRDVPSIQAVVKVLTSRIPVVVSSYSNTI